MKDDLVNPIIRNYIRRQTDITIDRYSDKGGFGELYFGKRNVQGDRVAVKFYQLDPSINSHEEPQLLTELKDEYIIPIFHAGIIDKDIAYYITPEIDGGDLQNVIDKYISEAKVMPTSSVFGIVRGVLKGLSELHKPPRNLVHRDLKTANILISMVNDRPFLADFGTIKKIPSGRDFVSASKYSFLYRPKEVILSDTYYKSSDLYQVGIILFQSLGGNFPINDPELWLKGRAKKKFDSLATRDKGTFLENHIEELIVAGKFLDLNTLPSYVSKKLRNVIKIATHPDCNKRYQSCSEFLKALHDAQGTKIWWVDSGVIYAECRKSRAWYRIVNRTEGLVVEQLDGKGKWRKKSKPALLPVLIEFIEADEARRI